MSKRSVSDINEETNQRIYERNIASAPLQMYYSPRAHPTKYTKIVKSLDDIKSESSVMSPYSIQNTFSPATTPGPWSGYAYNVDVETNLRNQVYGLQCVNQSTYKPSITSDLFSLQQFSSNCGKEQVNVSQSTQSHPYLFETYEYNNSDPNIINGSTDIFNNSTRNYLLGNDDR